MTVEILEQHRPIKRVEVEEDGTPREKLILAFAKFWNKNFGSDTRYAWRVVTD